jgi:hypothetical protein
MTQRNALVFPSPPTALRWEMWIRGNDGGWYLRSSRRTLADAMRAAADFSASEFQIIEVRRAVAFPEPERD